jgi:hypothetical protein
MMQIKKFGACCKTVEKERNKDKERREIEVHHIMDNVKIKLLNSKQQLLK